MKKEARQDLQIWSALAMLAFGCALTVAGFIVPPLGVISDSVLLVLAQCFIYAGSALGIDYYVNMKLKERPPFNPPGGGGSLKHLKTTDYADLTDLTLKRI